MTFLKNLPSNSLPTGKSFQSNGAKFPHPGLHIAVKYPKAGPNKGTIEISPNKTLQSLFMNVVASLKIHVPVTAVAVVGTIQPCKVLKSGLSNSLELPLTLGLPMFK